MSLRLEGKRAVVTGGSRGIGAAIVSAFAAEGAAVAFCHDGDAAGAATISNVVTTAGGQVFERNCDLSDLEQASSFFDDATRALGGIDILVNNAGIQFVSPVEDFPDDKWEQIIGINLSSAFYAIKAALPGMKKRGAGRIINLTSAHSLIASPFKSAYVAAKHGVAGLTKSVALEVATNGITVNAIAPGYVWTALVAKQIPDTMKARNMSEDEVKQKVLLAAQPTKAFVTVEQVAGLALYLASDAAASITGTTVSMDGGWTAQ